MCLSKRQFYEYGRNREDVLPNNRNFPLKNREHVFFFEFSQKIIITAFGNYISFTRNYVFSLISN